jgi:hypothetical protein
MFQVGGSAWHLEQAGLSVERTVGSVRAVGNASRYAMNLSDLRSLTRNRASQIKLVGGGGVSSPRTALDMTTFSEPESRAGVEAAEDW